MGRAISVLSGSATGFLPRPLLGIGSLIGAFWREMVRDAYRPERHYMRGPGPAWRAKHGSR